MSGGGVAPSDDFLGRSGFSGDVETLHASGNSGPFFNDALEDFDHLPAGFFRKNPAVFRLRGADDIDGRIWKRGTA